MQGVDSKEFVEILLSMKVVTDNDIQNANEIKKRNNKPLDTILLETGVVSYNNIMMAKASQLGVEFADLEDMTNFNKDIISYVSKNTITRYCIVPIEIKDDILSIAMDDPDDIYTLDDLRLATGMQIKPYLAEKEKILSWIDTYIHGKRPERPAERPVERPVEKQVERRAVERTVESTVERPVERRAVERPVESTVERPVERRAVERPVESTTERPVERRAIERPVEIPAEKPTISLNNNMQEKTRENPVNKNNSPEKKDDFEDFLQNFLSSADPANVATAKPSIKESEKFSTHLNDSKSIKNTFESSNTDLDLNIDDLSFGGKDEKNPKEIINLSDKIKGEKLTFGIPEQKGFDVSFDMEEINPHLGGFEDSNKKDSAISFEAANQKEKQKEKERAGLINYDINVDQTPMFKVRIGDYLLANHTITEQQLKEALAMHKTTGEFLGKVLVKKGFIKRRALYEFLENQLGVRYIDLDEVELKADILALVPENIAKMYSLIPYQVEGSVLKVAMADPLNMFAIEDLRFATSMEIQPMLSDDEQIKGYIDTHYEAMKNTTEFFRKKKEIDTIDQEFKKVNEEILIETSDDDVLIDESTANVEDAPIVKLVNIIFQGAVARKASDIHLEPWPDKLIVRYRVDGELFQVMSQDKKIINALVARIKIISGLNIAEKRLPQDGRITINVAGRPYDLRVSVLPTMFGEKVVIRIADKEGFNLDKVHLGFFQDDLEKFEAILDKPHGIVLVTGPTGSGKSTTLYTALRELSKPNVNIVTVEDPVEATIKGINQLQVNPKAGLDFALALRAFLRQDPDIIMVGEIRDKETAEIAVRAAITGHLVLSTLHTNDAPSSVTRIIDMGVEPYMIASALVGVIAQRLVRRLCSNCKTLKVLELSDKKMLDMEDGEEVTVYEAVGCEECNAGYRGRIAVHEVMELTRDVRDLVAKNASPGLIKDAAIKNGMKTIRDNCVRLIKLGTTTIEEMMTVSSLGE